MSAELDRAIDAATKRAYIVAFAALASAILTILVGPARSPTVAYVMLGVTALLEGTAVILSGKPLRMRTGFDVDFMVSRVWLPGFMGLVLPPAALVDACLRLFSKSVGGYHTTREGGFGNSYPKVALSRGEGRPLGVTLLTIAIVWPLAFLATVIR